MTIDAMNQWFATLESEARAKLHIARLARCIADDPEIGVVNGSIGLAEGRVIECVRRLDAGLERHTLADILQ